MKTTILLALLLTTLFTRTQAQDNDTLDIGIEVFVSKDIIKGTELSKCSFINDIDVSDSQTLVLASNDCFFSVGYGNYVSRKVYGKKVSSFCVLGNIVYFAEKSNLHIIGADNSITKIMGLPFSPRKLWSGKQKIYSVCRKGKKDVVYVVFPQQKEVIQFFSTTSPVVAVEEYNSLIFILTEKSIEMINTKDKKYEEFPINVEETGKLLSMAIDQTNGCLYLSSTNGVFRVYDGEFQKICRDIGVLCYDIEGMLLFNNKEPFVLRLRNSFLYPIPKGVVIEIK